MSHWTGDRNPGHERHLALWRAIEADFGEPMAGIIQGLREVDGGNSWRTVAGCLGISRDTLQVWRQMLDLPLDKHVKVYDPSSTPDHTPTDCKAQALGYENATDAVLDMRLRQGLTIKEAAKVLGVCDVTIINYTPPKVRGTIYNLSERGLQVRRQQAAEMVKRGRAKRQANPDWHPFNYGNARLFEERRGQRLESTQHREE